MLINFIKRALYPIPKEIGLRHVSVGRLLFVAYTLFWRKTSLAVLKYYQLTLQNFSKQYQYVALPKQDKTAPIVEIAYIPICDEVELIAKATQALYSKISSQAIAFNPEDIDTIVVPGDKANALGYALTLKLLEHNKQANNNKKVNLVVLRKSNKTQNMVYQQECKSITSKTTKTFYLTNTQYNTIKNKNILILDDIVTTGNTLNTAKILVEKADGKVLGFACIATEGKDWQDKNQYKNSSLLQLANMPYYIDGKEK